MDYSVIEQKTSQIKGHSSMITFHPKKEKYSGIILFGMNGSSSHHYKLDVCHYPLILKHKFILKWIIQNGLSKMDKC